MVKPVRTHFLLGGSIFDYYKNSINDALQTFLLVSDTTAITAIIY